MSAKSKTKRHILDGNMGDCMNSFSKLVAYLLVASVVLVGFSSSRCLAGLGDWSTWGSDNMITGELTINTIVIDGVTINEPGLDADGGTWNVASTKMSWSVEAIYGGDAIADYFHYAYTFSEDAQGTLSHINIEVSDAVDGGLGAFTLSPPDFFNSTITPYDVDTHSDSMPHDLYSIKWEETTDVTWTVEFDSARVPMWGDFYAKDGSKALYAYNTGFEYDPYSGNNLALYGYIARPDTAYVPVPGAVLLGILGLGVAGVKLRKFA